jgi:hypothetical protein
MHMARPFVIVAALLAAMGSSAVHSECVLPVPDGGDKTPTPANIEGHIASVAGDIIRIRPLTSSKLVSVRIPPDKSIFTAFGGAGDASELRVGQRAWVWYVGCRQRHSPVQQAAYFQIYSIDPNDQP